MISIQVPSSSRRGDSKRSSLRPHIISWLVANVESDSWKFRIANDIAIIDFNHDINATQFKLTWC